MAAKRLALAFVLLATLSSPAAADDNRRPITAQDLWAVKRVGAPALSPDGRRVVVGVQEWSIEKNKPSASLWLVDVATGSTRRLTSGSNDAAPAWSPDGRRLAFVSKRGEDEAAALYVLPMDGGEAEKLVELPWGVAAPAWLPDGRSLVFATQVIPELAGGFAKADLAAMKKEAKRRKESKMTAYASEYRQYRWFDRNLTDNLANRLLKVDVASKALVDLTPKYDRLFAPSGEVRFDVAPDGRHVALAINSTPPPYADQPNSDIVLVPTDGSGRTTNLTPDNRYGDDAPQFAPDGRSVYYVRVATANSQGELRRLWRVSLDDRKAVPVGADLDLSIDDIAFSADGKRLWVQAEQRGVVPVFAMDADGRGFAPVHAHGTSTELDSASGQLVFLNETSSHAPELFALDAATGKPRQLTRFNDALFARLDLGKVESHEFRGAGGDLVQAWVTYPPAYDPRKKYPLVQLLHGGPHTMNRDAFSYRWNSHVFASPGYIVAWVNRHGSTGFGEAFARSINGAWGDKPTEDILAANAYLATAIPAIDRDTIAAAGASYGGYLATWLAGHTKAFKTIVNHAGVSDFVGQYGADVTTYGFTKEVLGGTPWDSPEAMQRNNPVNYAANFSTPMLITHGEKDYRVPYGQGIALYGILQTMRVPSRLVVFPDENHWILSPQNAIYWNYEVQSWLARYIGGKPMAKPVFGAAE